MDVHILQFLGKSEHPSDFTNGFSYLQDNFFKSSVVAPPLSIHERTNDQPQEPISVTPVLPGTGSITHNVTRMLNDSNQLENCELPKTTYINENNNSTHEEDEKEQFADVTSGDEMSISPENSVSPGLSSARSSPEGSGILSLSVTPPSVESTLLSDTDSPVSAVSPPSVSHRTSKPDPLRKSVNNEERPTKKARTNYTNEQVQALLKIFHENPYPDSETMENIGKDLGINEKNVKIWFQNKRARWRRRVNKNQNSYAQHFLPTSPMLSPASPFGVIPTGHMMTSSPIQSTYGYHPFMQNYFSPNNQRFPVQALTNQTQQKYQTANQSVSFQNQALPAVPMLPFAPNVSSPQYGRTWSQPNLISSQNRQLY